MSKLELVFTGNNGKKLISVLRDSGENDTALDIAKNAQEAFENFASMISDYDLGDGDIHTLMYEPDDEWAREDCETIVF